MTATLLFAATAVAQKYEPPPPPIACVPTKKNPCTLPPDPAATAPVPAPAEKFPFPGEPGEAPQTPAAAANPFPGEPGDSKPATPSAPGSTADKFPFPGEPPAAATPANGAAQGNPFPGEPGESSSSSSSSSSSTSGAESIPDPDAAEPGKPLTRSQRRMLPKVEDMDHRELEDLDVSKYYISTGNFKAAYLRAQDAVKTIPDDPDAHYALALAADRLKLMPEAIKEYKAYLVADPEGIHAKLATRALAALAPK